MRVKDIVNLGGHGSSVSGKFRVRTWIHVTLTPMSREILEILFEVGAKDLTSDAQSGAHDRYDMMHDLGTTRSTRAGETIR